MAEQGLKLETITRILEDAEYERDYLVAINACKIWGRTPEAEKEQGLVEQWAQDKRWQFRAAALYGYGLGMAPLGLIQDGLRHSTKFSPLLHAAFYAMQGQSYDKEFIHDLLSQYTDCIMNDLGDLPEKMVITNEEIKEWLDDADWTKRYLAVRACANRSISPKKLLAMLNDDDWDVVRALMDVLRAKNVSDRILRRLWKSHPSIYLLRVIAGRDDMMDIIREAIPIYTEEAAMACRGVHFPLKEIGEWRVSPFTVERMAAAYASVGRSVVPDRWVEDLLRDRSSEVRHAAFEACEGRNLAPRRDFEPPLLVYKKCLHDVIVTAKIPDDAEIRGSLYGKARANKALIVGIDGDFYGEKVGVSMYDQATFYHVGDEVVVPDFYLGDDECDTGFHFFSSIEAAKNYYG